MWYFPLLYGSYFTALSFSRLCRRYCLTFLTKLACSYAAEALGLWVRSGKNQNQMIIIHPKLYRHDCYPPLPRRAVCKKTLKRRS